MGNKSKAKGTAFESQVVAFLRDRDLDAFRVALAGSGDVGDIHVRRSGGRIAVLECKTGKQVESCSPSQERAWFGEAQREAANVGTPADVGVLILKRQGAGAAKAGDHEVIIDLSDLNYLLGIGSKHMGAITVRIRLGEFAGALQIAGY